MKYLVAILFLTSVPAFSAADLNKTEEVLDSLGVLSPFDLTNKGLPPKVMKKAQKAVEKRKKKFISVFAENLSQESLNYLTQVVNSRVGSEYKTAFEKATKASQEIKP